MSVLIPGVLVIASFLLASVIMFGTFLTTSATQAQSLKELGKISQERVGSAISITSGSVTSSVTGSHTDMRLLVENTGSQSVVDFGQMDVIVQYTDAADNPVLSYLAYRPAGVGDNQWTNPVTGVTPDTFNPRIWDPDETFTIELRVAPDVKSGTSALVAVTTPGRPATRLMWTTNPHPPDPSPH
jgi:hypothetical protein